MLVLTNLFEFPWDTGRGIFNQQQLQRLAKYFDLTVLVPVPWPSALRNRRKLRAYRAAIAQRDGPLRVDHFLYWYVPGMGRSLNAVFMLLSLILQRAPTVLKGGWDCILGTWAFPDAVAAAGLGCLTGVPVVAKVHGTDINVYGAEPLKRFQIKHALNRCRRVVAVSQALSDRMIEIGVTPQKIAVVYNGVDPNLFYPIDRDVARRALGLDTATQIVLYVGNLLRSKGCLDLLEAAALSARKNPRLRLVMVGGGADLATLRRRAIELEFEDRLLLPGRLEHIVLVQWFGASNVFCLASHAEGVPNVVLEAMACGLPIVATAVGGIPEIVPELAGVTVPAGHVDDLANALTHALERAWNRDAIAAHARSFDWERSATQLRDLIEEACS